MQAILTIDMHLNIYWYMCIDSIPFFRLCLPPSADLGGDAPGASPPPPLPLKKNKVREREREKDESTFIKKERLKTAVTVTH